MYGLSIGVSSIGEALPGPVYALLSGLNAATVGIIALAAVQLSQKAITDKLTRLLVFFGAAAGLLYNALWYFPLLIAVAGVVTVVYDFQWLHPAVRAARRLLLVCRRKMSRARRRSRTGGVEAQHHGEATPDGAIELAATPATPDAASPVINAPSKSASVTQRSAPATHDPPANPSHTSPSEEPRIIPSALRFPMSWKTGLATILTFLASLTTIITLRSTLPTAPLLYAFFANMYLAGSVIFGGGPVVIPLLRAYVVAESWVSPRDFLIGLALIQAFPGPNFNFAVYLGSLTALNAGRSGAAGAALGFVGIFAPGLVTVHGTLGVWSAVRGRRGVRAALRGVNAAAVGLIYTAVYRLWQIGWVGERFQQGVSLADDPWWVVVSAASYTGGRWFGVAPAVAIVGGAGLGLVRYGVVRGERGE